MVGESQYGVCISPCEAAQPYQTTDSSCEIFGTGEFWENLNMGLFFELLQVSLGTRDCLSRVPSDDEWMTIYDESVRQTIVGLMFSGVEKLPREQQPPMAVKLQWIGMTQMVESTTWQNCERSKELSVKLKGAGFCNCLLKGVSVARYYPEPLRRQCGDVDLWTFGRRKTVMKWLQGQYEIGHNVWHNVEVDVFEDVPVEVHFHPGWLYNPFCNYRLQRFFEREREEKCFADETLGLNVMPLEFDAVYSLVHSYRHLIAGGIGLRHMIDYFYIVKKLNESLNCSSVDLPIVREKMLGLLQKFGLGKYASAVMWVLKEVCGMPDSYLLCESDSKEGRFLLEEIKRGGDLGKFNKKHKERRMLAQLVTMLPHYPTEVIWVLPWKCWHWCWRMVN